MLVWFLPAPVFERTHVPANDPSVMSKSAVEQLLRPLEERIQKLEQKVQEQDRRIAELIEQTLALMSR
jgi:hypothetical protein